MCNGAAVRSATLSNCRSDSSPANLGSKHCSLADLRLFTSGGAPEIPGAALGCWAGLPARRDSVRVRRCERCRPGLCRGRPGSEGEEARATKRRRAPERRPHPCRRRIPVSGLGKRQRHPRGPSCSGRASPRRAGDRPPLRCARAQSWSPRVCSGVRAQSPKAGGYDVVVSVVLPCIVRTAGSAEVEAIAVEFAKRGPCC